MREALFHVAKDPSKPDEILGVAMWLPPSATSNSTATWSTYWSSWYLYLGQIANNIWYMGRGGLRLGRYWAWKDAQAKVQGAVWPAHFSSSPKDDTTTSDDGCYFLNIMVARVGQQGRGIGGALMGAVTRRADAEGAWCYLESSRDEPNVAIYGRWGFRVAAELVCRDEDDPEDKGITLYAMARPPGATEPLSAEEARRPLEPTEGK